MSLKVFVLFLTTFLSTSLTNWTIASSVVNSTDKTLIDLRIYHGDATDITHVPYTVFIKILRESPRTEVTICGGVILDPVTVLTAGHCVEHSRGIQIIAGSSNPLTDKSVQRRVPYVIVMHPEYKYDTLLNTTVFDFALVKLRTPFTFNRKVKAAALPKANETVPAGSMGEVCGWGSTDEAESMSRTLLCTSAHILTNTYCDTLQRKISLSSDMICTGRSSCQGDSGSGLIHTGVVIGIVSFTMGPCSYAVPPVVYGKVSFILDFIRENTETSGDVIEDDRIFFPDQF